MTSSAKQRVSTDPSTDGSTIETVPWYRPVSNECEIFEHAYHQNLPLLLKGPTGCGKTRFVEHMAARLGRPLISVACHDETSAVDLVGRHLIGTGSETYWQDGPVARAVREGAILYLDEFAEARSDVVVVIHPLADHRRRLYIERTDEEIDAAPGFMLVASYNPGYQHGMKDLKPSTKQRFLGLAFDYPSREIETEIIRGETGIGESDAKRLSALGARLRALEAVALAESPSTRLLVNAARLIKAGFPPRAACQTAIVEALEEVDLREVLRGGEQAHSLLKSNISLDAEVPQVGQSMPGEKGLLYDEWDARKSAYRKDWCTVYPTAFDRTRPEWPSRVRDQHRPLIRDLTRRLETHRSRLESVDRQPDGEDIDLRAIVAERAAQLAGRGGNTRLYTRRAKRRRDFATTVLLDLSLSSDSWVDGRRVLDVAREAAFVLGEVTRSLGDRIQILAFASHTRNHCRVWEICGWDDAWSVASARLGALEPQGFTRIGPAIRHATAELSAQSADARLLLLLSDGKPTDYDRYEGRYGIADVRHALLEAERAGVSPHALAVDRVASDYLPAMFGTGGWHILPNPNRLPEVLTTVYGRLTGG